MEAGFVVSVIYVLDGDFSVSMIGRVVCFSFDLNYSIFIELVI